ncbi:MAG TPA: hypothetical protein VLT60_04755 [Usitatibacter sp.]|nr:hypothetical protein [Usitatibacter sp.]
MKDRDQFVKDLKSSLDRWNAEAAKWEARAEQSRDAYLAAYHAKRDEALYQLKLLEKASSSAYDDVAKGTDLAWKALSEAYDKALTHFEKPSSKARR